MIEIERDRMTTEGSVHRGQEVSGDRSDLECLGCRTRGIAVKSLMLRLGSDEDSTLIFTSFNSVIRAASESRLRLSK